MPTLDLGKIKFVWKGAYNGATTYEVDDVVSYQGSSYIYKNATAAAGNLPTDAAYWDLLAQGSDLSILNTQGQILFRGASNLQALAPSTSGYILRTNGAGANPSWDSPASLIDAGSAVEAGPYPKKRMFLNGDNGSHIVTKNGRVFFGGADVVSSAVGSASDAEKPSGAPGFISNPLQPCVLPGDARAAHVFDFYDVSFVIDTDGNLYSSGTNASGQLGLGLLASGPAGATTADVTNRSRYTRVVFPTHNYPQIGSTNTPKIVHVYAGNSENASTTNRVYAIDSHGFLWGWGDNTSNYLGIGTGYGATIASPVRIPTFMAAGTVNANSSINQPAASGTRRRVKKVQGITSSAEMFCLIEKDDTNTSTESGVYFWGNNTGCTTSGNATATAYSTPQQFTRGSLALPSGEWVVDIIANSTRNDDESTGTFTVLTNNGVMTAIGKNTYGVLATNNTTNAYGNAVTIGTSTVGGGTWATPTTWTVPAGMTNANFNVQWTPATFNAQHDSLDENWSFSGTFRYAKTSNQVWCFWGTQGDSGAGAAGVGNLTAAQYQPTVLSFRDSQHEEDGSARKTTGADVDQFTSIQLTTGNVFGFTISKLVHVGGMWASASVVRNNAIAMTSSGRIYMTGYNAHSQHGTGDVFTSTGFFRRVRLDAPISTKSTLKDIWAVRGHSGNGSFRALYDNGDLYTWGYNTSGSAMMGQGVSSVRFPSRVPLNGAITNTA